MLPGSGARSYFPGFLPNPLIFKLVRVAISPSHGHWDQGSTSQPQLKQEVVFFLVPVFPYPVCSGKDNAYPTASNPLCLIYTSSPFTGSSSINKTFHREVISGLVTSLTQSILTQPLDLQNHSKAFPTKVWSWQAQTPAHCGVRDLYGTEGG